MLLLIQCSSIIGIILYTQYKNQQKLRNCTLNTTNNIPITIHRGCTPAIPRCPLHRFCQSHLEYFIFVRLKRVEFQLQIAQVPQGNCLQGGWKRVTEALTTTLNTCVLLTWKISSLCMANEWSFKLRLRKSHRATVCKGSWMLNCSHMKGWESSRDVPIQTQQISDFTEHWIFLKLQSGLRSSHLTTWLSIHRLYTVSILDECPKITLQEQNDYWCSRNSTFIVKM